ncbi:MAG: hypothetical protein EZS28_045749, partial [Streblomastix strix]
TNANWDIWSKRRQGVSIMADYMKINDIKFDYLLNNSPEIHIVNAMTWVNDMGGKNRMSKIISHKTHTSTTLSQFFKMAKISDSPLIRSLSRCLNLNAELEARCDAIWNIERLFNYIRQTQFVLNEEKQLLSMSILVYFSAVRMTELSRMTLKEMQSSGIFKKEYKHPHTNAVKYSLTSYEKQVSSSPTMVPPSDKRA